MTVSIVAQTVTKKTPLPFLHSSALLMFSASLYLSHLTLLSDIWKMLLTAMVHFLVQRLKSDLFFEVQSLERLKGEKKNFRTHLTVCKVIMFFFSLFIWVYLKPLLCFSLLLFGSC